MVEQGVPLAQVRDLLGHASITTTERYDNQTLENLQLAVRKLERGHTFAGTKFQDSFKIAHVVSGAEPQPSVVPGERAERVNWLNIWDELRNWIVTAA